MMKKYWFCVTLSNGIEVSNGQVEAANTADAKRKAKARVKKLFPRKKIIVTDVQVKLM